MRETIPGPVYWCMWTCLVGLLTACPGGEGAPAPRAASLAAEASPQPPPAELRLVVMSDLQGYLEPCGCQKVPLGGIDRAATQLKALSADGVPTLLLGVGDLLAEAPGAHPAPEGAETQELWKAEVLGEVLGGLGLKTALLGPADRRFGVEMRDRILARAGIVALAGAQASRVLEAGGHRVGVWGLTAGPAADAAAIAAQATQLGTGLRAQGAEVVVGLLNADQRTARRLAAQPGAPDLLVLGGLKRDEPTPPARVGETTLLTGGQHGRGLLVVDLLLSGKGPLADASAWTREHAQEAARAGAADLQARIEAWQVDPKVDPALLSEQRARLARMRSEIAAGKAPVVRGRQLRARYLPLTPAVKSHPATKQALGAYDRRVNAHNREAFAELRPVPAPAGSASYVGSERCGRCHAPALAWWKTHAHGRAYATLQQRHKEYNLSCVGCHVTGYDRPGGSTVTHNEGLTNVGCESCHGPGSQHPQKPGSVVPAPPAETCVGCHNAEHSDAFDYEVYRARLMAPGHGMPVGEAP